MSNGIVQISCLGHLGRFGNQLFQYAFARAYAESTGAKLETPPWIGQDLFEGIADPPLSIELPRLGLDEHPHGKTNINLNGYFQHESFFKSYTLSKIRSYFRFKQEWLDCFPYVPGKIAVHLRRGDYKTQYSTVFCTISAVAYIKAMSHYGYRDQTNVEIVDEERPTLCMSAGKEFLADFFRIYNADVVFRANSTFSWWAATLGHAKDVFAPVVKELTGPQTDVQFVRGNWPRCVSLPNTSDLFIAP